MCYLVHTKLISNTEDFQTLVKSGRLLQEGTLASDPSLKEPVLQLQPLG